MNLTPRQIHIIKRVAAGGGGIWDKIEVLVLYSAWTALKELNATQTQHNA